MKGVRLALAIAAIMATGTVAEPGQGGIPSVRSRTSQAPPCDDVRKLDFKNLTIETAQRTFAFHNGIAANHDDPLKQDAKDSHPDWKAEIQRDSVIQPAPNVVVRLLVIHDSHQTGSGWRFYATGLRCIDGILKEVFHRDGMSLTIDPLDSTTISVGLKVTPGALTRKHWSYVWDRGTSTYVLSSTQ